MLTQVFEALPQKENRTMLVKPTSKNVLKYGVAAVVPAKQRKPFIVGYVIGASLISMLMGEYYLKSLERNLKNRK